MCGIAGRFNFSVEEVVPQELVLQMTRLIAYRGPDGEGYHFDRNCALGHRRLIIIDPEGGHQPIHNEDQTVWVSFNGEVYNYIELREDLRARGHRFTTKSDTEVLVHLYEEFGPRFVEQINGMFAIALWDAREQSLYLYRDRLGVKPLYFTKSRRGVAFASEIKCLLLDPEVNREMDPQSFFDLLTYGYVPPPRTLFKGVEAVPPGHFLVCSAAGVRQEKYWEIALEVDDSQSQEQSAAELLELLADATRLRLRSDVPLGAFLSGGLDSSAVVALAARLLSHPLLTFSIGFKEETFNELPYARQVSRLFGTRSHEKVVEADLASLLPRVVWHSDQPHGDPSFLPLYAMSQVAREHATVVLNGDGGDEFLGGYRKYAEFRPQDLAPEADPLEAYYNTDYVSVFRDAEKERVLDRGFLTASRLEPSDRILRDLMGRASHLDFGWRMLYFDQKMLLPGNNLVKPDRMGSPQPIEFRSPFLDYRVVELTNRIPFAQRVCDGVTKQILKTAVRHLLPPEIVHREKQMFAVPIGQWFRAGARDFIRDMLCDAKFAGRGIFDAQRVRELLDAHLTGRANYTRQLRLILNIELWFQIFLDRTVVSEPVELMQNISERMRAGLHTTAGHSMPACDL